MTPRAARWLKMAEGARRMADQMRDPDSKQILLEIADNFDSAVWTANADAADADKPD